MDNKDLSVAKSLAYVAPVVALSMLHAPALSILPALYAKHAAISMATIGLVLTAARLVDVLTDPLIGYFSDNTRSALGRRKPWMIAGAALASISAFFWMRPHADAGALWFLTASIAVSLGWTLIEIPHLAWMNELSRSYHGRSRLAAFRAGAHHLGYLIFISAPLWPIFPTTEMTPEVTAAISWLVLALLPLGVSAATIAAPESVGAPRAAAGVGLGEIFSAFRRNRPFQILLMALAFAQLSVGMVAALYFFYIDAYLGILDRIAHIGLVTAIASFASVPLWPKLLRHIDKHRAMTLCVLTTALTLVAMGSIRPGESAYLVLAAVFSLSAIFAAGSQVCVTAIIADVIDYDELRTGENKAGVYYAATTFAQKLAIALGGGAAFLIAGLFGFQPDMQNTELALTGFFVAFIGLPVTLNIASALAAFSFPITRRRHRAIQLRLARRPAEGLRSEPAQEGSPYPAAS